MKLIVGLGNPGRRYEQSRHNLGFKVVDLLASRWGVCASSNKFGGRFGRGTVGDQSVGLLMPETFMNRSGQAVLEALQFYKVFLSDLLVVLDDLDLPVGRVRVRPKGSAGGHNGLMDVIARLGDDGFARVRIGIDKPVQGDAVSYVLSRFEPDEQPVIEKAVVQAADAVECWVAEGIDAAMNKFNTPSCVEPDSPD